MKKVFENPFAEIYDIRDEVNDTVFAYWKGFLSLDFPEAIEACQFSLDFFKAEGIKAMISDHTYLESASLDFLDWIQKYYFPTCIKNGLRAEIILESSYAMGNITLELMYDQEDLQKNMSAGNLYTPKAKNLETAKEMARKVVAHNCSLN
ncbi:hypothetical protein [Rhodoflexus sp.]